MNVGGQSTFYLGVVLGMSPSWATGKVIAWGWPGMRE